MSTEHKIATVATVDLFEVLEQQVLAALGMAELIAASMLESHDGEEAHKYFSGTVVLALSLCAERLAEMNKEDEA